VADCSRDSDQGGEVPHQVVLTATSAWLCRDRDANDHASRVSTGLLPAAVKVLRLALRNWED